MLAAGLVALPGLGWAACRRAQQPPSIRHITDSQGGALPGTTVLMQGTRQAASTNAAGGYVLTVPRSSTLQFGYGGGVDQLQYTGASVLNVVLLPAEAATRHRK